MVITSENDNQNVMGSTVKKALVQANIEKRLVLGLPNIVRCLAVENSNIPILCLIAPPKTGDYATHMQEVLLQAYCLENDIYILHLDSAEKLSRILHSTVVESCALIYASSSGDSDCEGSFLDEDYNTTRIERRLINYCEDHWDDSEHSTIRLPEKWDALSNHVAKFLTAPFWWKCQVFAITHKTNYSDHTPPDESRAKLATIESPPYI